MSNSDKGEYRKLVEEFIEANKKSSGLYKKISSHIIELAEIWGYDIRYATIDNIWIDVPENVDPITNEQCLNIEYSTCDDTNIIWYPVRYLDMPLDEVKKDAKKFREKWEQLKKEQETENLRKEYERLKEVFGKTGHWGFLKYDEACCSECGHIINTHFDTTDEAREKWGELPKYCEECGTKMDLTVRSGFPRKRKSKNEKV